MVGSNYTNIQTPGGKVSWMLGTTALSDHPARDSLSQITHVNSWCVPRLYEHKQVKLYKNLHRLQLSYKLGIIKIKISNTLK